METSSYFSVLQRRWKLVLACLAVGLVAGFMLTPKDPKALGDDWSSTIDIMRAPETDKEFSLAQVELVSDSGEVAKAVGAKLGTDPSRSVTTPDGLFHFTENVYAASPALFPSIGSPNPMLTGIALIHVSLVVDYKRSSILVDDMTQFVGERESLPPPPILSVNQDERLRGAAGIVPNSDAMH